MRQRKIKVSDNRAAIGKRGFAVRQTCSHTKSRRDPAASGRQTNGGAGPSAFVADEKEMCTSATPFGTRCIYARPFRLIRRTSPPFGFIRIKKRSRFRKRFPFSAKPYEAAVSTLRAAPVPTSRRDTSFRQRRRTNGRARTRPCFSSDRGSSCGKPSDPRCGSF